MKNIYDSISCPIIAKLMKSFETILDYNERAIRIIQANWSWTV